MTRRISAGLARARCGPGDRHALGADQGERQPIEQPPASAVEDDVLQDCSTVRLAGRPDDGRREAARDHDPRCAAAPSRPRRGPRPPAARPARGRRRRCPPARLLARTEEDLAACRRAPAQPAPFGRAAPASRCAPAPGGAAARPRGVRGRARCRGRFARGVALGGELGSSRRHGRSHRPATGGRSGPSARAARASWLATRAPFPLGEQIAHGLAARVVEIVGRLVEQQHVRRIEQQPRDRQPRPLPAAEPGDIAREVEPRQPGPRKRVLEPRGAAPLGKRRVVLAAGSGLEPGHRRRAALATPRPAATEPCSAGSCRKQSERAATNHASPFRRARTFGDRRAGSTCPRRCCRRGRPRSRASASVRSAKSGIPPTGGGDLTIDCEKRGHGAPKQRGRTDGFDAVDHDIVLLRLPGPSGACSDRVRDCQLQLGEQGPSCCHRREAPPVQRRRPVRRAAPRWCSGVLDSPRCCASRSERCASGVLAHRPGSRCSLARIEAAAGCNEFCSSARRRRPLRAGQRHSCSGGPGGRPGCRRPAPGADRVADRLRTVSPPRGFIASIVAPEDVETVDRLDLDHADAERAAPADAPPRSARAARGSASESSRPAGRRLATESPPLATERVLPAARVVAPRRLRRRARRRRTKR